MPDKELTVVISAEDKASAQLEKLNGNLNKISRSSDDLEKGLKNIRNGMAIVGAASAAVTISVVEQAGKFEQYKVALNTMLGSVDKANELFGQLKEFAKVTPFNFEEVVTGSKQLLAMGSSAQSVIPELRMLGDVASGLNVPLDQLVLTFGKVETQGKLTGREVMEFSRAGVPLVQTLADQFGVTKDKISDMVSAGKIGFEDVKKAFGTMTGAGGKFFNLMEAESKTALGKFSNFQDSVQQLQASIGNLLLPVVKRLIDAVIPLIDRFTQFANKNPQLVTGLIAVGLAMGAIATAAFVLAPIITTVALLASGLGVTFLAMTGIIGVFIAATVGLIAAGIAIYQNWDMIKMKASELLTNITIFATGILTAVTTSFSQLVANVTTFFQTVWTTITNFIAGIGPAIYTLFVETIPYAIGFALASFVRLAFEAPGLLLQLYNSAVQTIGNLVTSVTNFFTQLVTDVVAKMGQFFVSVSEWFTKTKENVKTILSNFPNVVSDYFNKAKEGAINIAQSLFEGVSNWIGKVIDLFNTVKAKAEEAINKAKEAFHLGGQAGASSHQHGGIVPGGPNDAVPTILHGGERIIPRTGTDVNSGGGGGGITINLSIAGDVNSMDMVNTITEAIKNSLNRESELARLGVSV